MARPMGAEERRRQRELEEARKAGLVAPALDEEGRAINPHIPRYMSEAPWYASTEGPSLRHQRDWRERKEESGVDAAWYDRGARAARATRYRKGACSNCGSMSHSAKDCLERPRRRGAKLTGRGIAADDVTQEVSLVGYDAKRDRWNGFGADDWERTVADSKERIAKLREERARQTMLAREEEQEEAGKEGGKAGGGGASSASGSGASSAAGSGAGSGLASTAAPPSSAASDRLDDSAAGEFGRVERRVRTVGGGASGTVRNLRIREDKAKYLLNLDPNSAYYDPKSRSMRENPFAKEGEGAGGESTVLGAAFRGDAALARSGGALEAAALAAFAERAAAQSGDAEAVHPNAAPSAAERAFSRAREAERRQAEARAKEARDAYGDAAAGAADPLRGVQAEADYAEYDEHGRLLKSTGQEYSIGPRAGAARGATGGGGGGGGAGSSAATSTASAFSAGAAAAAAAAAALPRSRYEEDSYPGNHSSVWGSFWRDGRWGYACCHALERGAYCAGEAGKKAADAAWKRSNAQKCRENEEKAHMESEEKKKRTSHAKTASGERKDGFERAALEGAHADAGRAPAAAPHASSTASQRPFLPPSGPKDASLAAAPSAPGLGGERWGRAGGEGGIEGVLGIVAAGGQDGGSDELDQTKLREAIAKARKRAREEREERDDAEARSEQERGQSGDGAGRGPPAPAHRRLRGAEAAEAGLAGAADMGALTAEDAEAYRMLREREDDPMRDLDNAQGKGEGGYDYV